MGGEELALIGAAIAVGIGAALLPVFVNAEVYVVTMGATVNSKPFLALLILIHVAATTVGKAFVFQLARKGTNKIRMVNPKPPRNRPQPNCCKARSSSTAASNTVSPASSICKFSIKIPITRSPGTISASSST